MGQVVQSRGGFGLAAGKEQIEGIDMTFLGLMVCLVFLAVIPVKTYSFEVNGRFLNYGNGMINLDNVTHIGPQVIYIVTLPQDSLGEQFKEYQTSDMSQAVKLEGTLGWFNPEHLERLDFYYLKIVGQITFDNFNLRMFKKIYLKVPSDRGRVRELYPEKFSRFMDRLPYLGSEVQSASPLMESDAVEVRQELRYMMTSYDKIDDLPKSWSPF